MPVSDRLSRRRFLAAAPLGASLAGLPSKAPAAEPDWAALIRKDHPRLFFNRDTFPAVKARALGAEKELFASMRQRVDELAAGSLEPGDYGVRAAEAAFVFLVTGEESYGDFAARLLENSIDWYHARYAQKKSVSWYSFSRINAWAAYDWLFDHLGQARRKRLGASFLKAVLQVQPTRDRESFPWENWLPPISGFYSTPSLLWYAGVATFGDGIDDPLAARLTARGYQLFLELLRYRARAAADDGGSASGALNYALAAYPWAEFNFFHTFRSATGRNIADDWPYVAYLPGWVFWNWLPGGREFGYGDAYHTSNRIGLRGLSIHLAQIVHFYAESKPECAAFARWLMQRTPRERRSSFPCTRFLLTHSPKLPPLTDPARKMPLARHFENMGQIFFRSGSGPDDTYALFTAGGVLEMHKHFDHNNFVIYKKGFLALDTGTRPEPGIHLTHYYCRTVAHNCILIHMPGEQMPRYWGRRAPGEPDLPVPNDGGQRRRIGSKVAAFETTPEYAYVAGDATPVYHPQKCRLALRQFVFLPPNHFVVFDRVVSTKAEYKKTWLLHTAAEPLIEGRTFTAAHEQGRLFCRTLLPQRARITKIGGPGKQFWSGGRNWPLPPGYRTPDTHPLLGQWRVEISPEEPRTEDLFLHLIEAGDAALPSMAEAELLQGGDHAGVRFRYGEKTWEVLFGIAGEPSGRIKLTVGGEVRVDQELTRQVQPQSGLYGGPPDRA